MVMPLVDALTAVALGQLDSLSVNSVDGAEMDAVGADHFHMFANPGCVGHDVSPLKLPTITNDGTIGCIGFAFKAGTTF
jgi:hypothetical protein